MSKIATRKLFIWHTNDVHGQIEGLARVATILDELRAQHANTPNIYIDAGDIEETSVRLSNLTKGVAMHQLLNELDAKAHAVGNGALLRYSPPVLALQAEVAHYPLLLANLKHADGTDLAGVQATTLIKVGDIQIGIIGVTAPMRAYTRFFDLQLLDILPLVRRLATELRQAGAEAVIVLSHLGLEADRALANELNAQDPLAVQAILGAHSHDLLSEGEWIGKVLIAQAGDRARYIGQVVLTFEDGQPYVTNCNVIPVAETVAPAPRVLQRTANLEAEVEKFLDAPLITLTAPLDYAELELCPIGNLGAEVLRQWGQANVGLLQLGHAFNGALPAGAVRRLDLWQVCPSTANPGVVTMTGEQLNQLMQRGRDTEFASQRPHSLRGGAVGFVHISGGIWDAERNTVCINGQPIDTQRQYKIAATDGELEPDFGLVEADWNLRPAYDISMIMRDVIEQYWA